MLSWQSLLSFLLFLDPSSSIDYTTEHCSAFKTHVHDNDYNRVFCTMIPDEKEIAAIQSLFLDTPYSWLVHVDDIPLQHVLLEHGLVKIPQSLPASPLMVLDVQNFVSDCQISPNFFVRKINCSDFQDVMIWIACKFENTLMAHDVYEFIMMLQERYGKCCTLYLGYYNLEPVVTMMTIEHENIIALHSVFTLPVARRQGFASMMLQSILQYAQQNDSTHAILLSSASGRSVYEKLGFRELAEFYVYGNYLGEI